MKKKHYKNQLIDPENLDYKADHLYPQPVVNADEKLDIAAWIAAGRPSPCGSESYPLLPTIPPGA